MREPVEDRDGWHLYVPVKTTEGACERALRLFGVFPRRVRGPEYFVTKICVAEII